MRIAKISFLLFFPLTALTLRAQTTPVLQIDRPVNVFTDHADPAGRLLLASENGQVDFVQSERVVNSRHFRVTHPDCKPLTPNTVSMDAPGGLTLAYPFLAGTDRVCMFDEKTGALRPLARFGAGLPSGAFSAVYAGSAGDDVFFLINGREFPEATTGYIHLLHIERSTLRVRVQPLITDVPGYSAGMLYEQNKIWIGSHPGRLFRIMTADLHARIRGRGTVKFSEIAAESFRTGDGLNSYVLGNRGYFLFFNDTYESYVIERRTGFRYIVNPPCPPVSAHGDRWLLLCRGQSLESWQP